MEKSSSSADAVTKALVRLARNNINILEVKYTEGADGPTANAVLFEYQWRVTPTATKWTRAVLPWITRPTANALEEFAFNYDFILAMVREFRAGLEG